MMLSQRQYRASITIAMILAMLTNAWSTVRLFFHPLFQGLLPYGGSEEAMYLIRTQQALFQPFTNVTNGVWTAPPALGLQSAGAEQLIGALFFWTGIPAPWLVFFLFLAVASLMIPLSAELFRRVGAGRGLALLGSIALFVALVYCHRFFHPSFSQPLIVGALLLLWRWYDRPTIPRAVALGIALGFSIGVYLWAWTFLFATMGIFSLFILFDPSHPRRSMIFRSLPWLLVATFFAGLPSIHHLINARLSPFYAETAVRAGLVHSRFPESPARSTLMVFFFLVSLWMFRRKEDRRSLLPLLAMLGSLALMYNQQLMHGYVMSFSSHYIPSVCVVLTTLVVTLLVRRQWSLLSLGTLLLSLCVILLNTHDIGGLLSVFDVPSPHSLSTQHFRGAIDTLMTQPRRTILTDRFTADIVAEYTHHDTVFTEYSAFILISDEEYIDRACVSELFSPTMVDFKALVTYAEAHLRVLRKQETVERYEQRLREAEERCTALRSDPLPALQTYHITHLLWDEMRVPSWVIDRRFFQQIATGEGWSLWSIKH